MGGAEAARLARVVPACERQHLGSRQCVRPPGRPPRWGAVVVAGQGREADRGRASSEEKRFPVPARLS